MSRDRRLAPRGTAEGRKKRRRFVDQETINRRMREIWVDGYGLIPTSANEEHYLGGIRIALRELVNDDAYWSNLNKLLLLKDDVARMMERCKAAPGRASSGPTKPSSRRRPK